MTKLLELMMCLDYMACHIGVRPKILSHNKAPYHYSITNKIPCTTHIVISSHISLYIFKNFFYFFFLKKPCVIIHNKKTHTNILAQIYNKRIETWAWTCDVDPLRGWRVSLSSPCLGSLTGAVSSNCPSTMSRSPSNFNIPAVGSLHRHLLDGMDPF